MIDILDKDITLTDWIEIEKHFHHDIERFVHDRIWAQAAQYGINWDLCKDVVLGLKGECSMGRSLRNWIESYIEFTDKAEPPESFHFWTAISTLATVLGRKIWFNRGHYKLYPNFYVILIAGSAKCRKSTALRMGYEMLDRLHREQKIRINKNKVTLQRLIQALGQAARIQLPGTTSEQVLKGSECLLYATELTTLLHSNAHKDGLLATLTDLYDCPDRWENETKTAGFDYLYNVCLNILGATTPEELSAVMPIQAVGSGFTSRIIFVFQRTTTRCIPRPELFYTLPEKKELKDKLITDIRYIYENVSGEFSWSADAAEYYDAWYGKLPEAEEEKMEGYIGRKHDTAIKLAMVMSAAIKDDLIITKEILRAAIYMLDEVEKFMSGVYTYLSNPSSMAGDIQWTIKQLIRAGGSMTHSNLMKKGWCRFNAQSFALLIDTMGENHMKIIRSLDGSHGKRIYSLIDPEQHGIVPRKE